MLSRQQKWDRRYLRLARELASFSKDPSTGVGCIVADEDGDIIAATFNGLPRGVHDSVERLSNRDLKYRMIEHAERNATRVATKKGGDAAGTTFYVYPFQPCGPCAAHLAQHKVKRIVSMHAEDAGLIARWSEDITLANQIYREAGICLDLYFAAFLDLEDDT